MRKFFILLTAIFILLVSSTILWADEKSVDIKKTEYKDIFSDVFGHYPIPNVPTGDDVAVKKSKLDIPKNWEFGIEAKRLVASHTSYEFGDPEAPFTKPLSRLEFPVNTWWLNLDLRRTCPRWSIGTKAGLSVNRNSN